MANITIDYNDIVAPVKSQNISNTYVMFQSYGIETLDITFNELTEVKCIGGLSLPTDILGETLSINGNVVSLTLGSIAGADKNVYLDITALGV